MFYVGGKKVFIKVVAHAIPVYTMSTFKLPLSLCKKINAMCAKFLWGYESGNRKNH